MLQCLGFCCHPRPAYKGLCETPMEVLYLLRATPFLMFTFCLLTSRLHLFHHLYVYIFSGSIDPSQTDHNLSNVSHCLILTRDVKGDTGAKPTRRYTCDYEQKCSSTSSNKVLLYPCWVKIDFKDDPRPPHWSPNGECMSLCAGALV